MSTITAEQGDKIREAWYIMDGLSDRPKTVPECWVMLEEMLELIGEITGITNAGVVSPAVVAAKDWFDREVCFAIDAHEYFAELHEQVMTILNETGSSDDDQYRRAAQLIACSRNTCGGPNGGHDHIA